MRIALAAVLALAMFAAAPAKAGDAEDIQAVIADQLAAFQREDLDAAFAHASPMIQGKFGNPFTFGAMVARGYPMIWRPERVEMGAMTTGPRGPQQTVLFEDAEGVLWEVDYMM
ncbi:MAG: DUF4864 domain-containing protein, partial [Pseudomonadota bacterium]